MGQAGSCPAQMPKPVVNEAWKSLVPGCVEWGRMRQWMQRDGLVVQCDGQAGFESVFPGPMLLEFGLERFVG